MFFKLDKYKAQMTVDMQDAKFCIVNFAPVHYFGNIPLWSNNALDMITKTPDMFVIFYVIEDKFSHTPFAISDSKDELQIYADLNGMELSECNEESLI